MKADLWLAGILGYPVWRIEDASDGESLSALESDIPVFAYAKVGASDIASVSRLVGSGFLVVDVALTFDAGIIAPTSASDGVRLALPEDREAVARVARGAFRFSRFHLDPLVPNGIADTIKSAWAVNYFEGRRGDGMVVAERDGCIVGFLQLIWTAPDSLVIDLIGVDPAWQGQGIGRDMIVYAARHGTGDGRVPAGMTVGTQAANAPSVRLYESLGFRLASAQYVMHFHGVAMDKK
ncbi:MAG: GNAT family N-acetyltransferase [Rhodocyclaceae bacterium]|nr:GNAT family N-acetyltransferase [Rhodocyclaceae bacterium]MDZ4215554.1 GNAT family N-acetyltransferase [Rhodocyclaceae bacterium]